MLIKSKDFKNVCKTVLSAIDNSEISTLTETLELKTVNNILYLSTTNKEYYCSIKFQLEHEEDFRASVNATLFLKLIAAVTSENIELTVADNYMMVKANGNYKIPLIFEDDHLMEVPEIKIENKTVEMNIASSILQSIVNYNTKQLSLGSVAQPVQKMFYIDNEGCITFTSGACVNNFILEKPVKVLLNARLVNLFKLFKDDLIQFTLGYDPLTETIIQTKVSFETPTIKLVAITGCDDSLLGQVPVNAIRGRANKEYPNKVVLNVAALSEALSRLLLFSAGYGDKTNLKPYSAFDFIEDKVIIYDTKKENTETLLYQNGIVLSEPYTITLDVNEFKKILDGCAEQYITLNFGDHKACVVTRNSIRNVMPEVIVRSN